jgi:hypothetical protein
VWFSHNSAVPGTNKLSRFTPNVWRSYLDETGQVSWSLTLTVYNVSQLNNDIVLSCSNALNFILNCSGLLQSNSFLHLYMSQALLNHFQNSFSCKLSRRKAVITFHISSMISKCDPLRWFFIEENKMSYGVGSDKWPRSILHPKTLWYVKVPWVRPHVLVQDPQLGPHTMHLLSQNILQLIHRFLADSLETNTQCCDPLQ